MCGLVECGMWVGWVWVWKGDGWGGMVGCVCGRVVVLRVGVGREVGGGMNKKYENN